MLEIQRQENGTVNAKFKFADETEIKDTKKEVYKKIKKNFVVNGFRKGKVPIPIAEMHLGLDTLYGRKMTNILMKSLLDQDIYPYQYTKFKIEKDLSVDTNLYPLQQIKFDCDVKTLQVTEQKPIEPKATEEEIKTAKEVLMRRNSAAMVHEGNSEYKAKNGDDIIVDFEITVDNSEDKPQKVENHPITLGFGAMHKTLEDKLIGIGINESRDVEIDIKDHNYKYKVTCKKIVQVDMIDEKELLNIMGLEAKELTEKLEKELTDSKKAKTPNFVDMKRIATDKLIDSLKKHSDFKMPETMLEDLTKESKSDIEKKLIQDIHKSNYERKCLLIAAADQLGIKCTEEELEIELKKLKKKDTDDIDRVSTGTSVIINKVLDILITKEEEENESVQSQQG